jgi:hypothetical protein
MACSGSSDMYLYKLSNLGVDFTRAPLSALPQLH